MPLYYFDVLDGERFIRDETGHECADVAAIRRAAIESLPGMASDVMPDGDRHSIAVKVRDGDGVYVYEAALTLNAGPVDR
ncbi:DUF6894 family protein [Jiella marina]